MASEKEIPRRGDKITRKVSATAVHKRFIPSQADTKHDRSGHWVIRCGRSLGLKVKSREGFIRKIREGLDIKALEYFSHVIELSDRELAQYADISVRTLARRKQEGKLQADESDRVARISMLFDEAVNLFDNDEKRAAYWFRTPKKALGGASPIEYADTEPGAQEVRDLIGRIEHGVFA